MARRVGDDEIARAAGKKTVGNIDSDALLALGLKPIHHQRQINIFTGGTEFGAVAGDCGKLVVEQRVLLKQQPPDQRRLAIVNTATGEETQMCRARGHQK